MPEQRGDRFEGHAAVDRLGRECVPELVRGHAADPGRLGGVRDRVPDALLADPSAALDEQVWLAQTRGTLGDPLVEHLFELGVQGDIAVGAELPERHVQPVRGADLHDRVDGQVEELALAKPGAGEELDREPGERVGMLAGGAQQLGGRGVIDEPGQRLIAARDITGEHQHARGSVLAIPLAQSIEAHAQRAELLGQRDVRESPATHCGPRSEMTLVALDVSATQIADRGDLGRVRGQPDSELAQDRLDADHRGRSEREAHLPDVSLERGT